MRARGVGFVFRVGLVAVVLASVGAGRSVCAGEGQTSRAPAFSVVSVKLSPESEADDWGIGVRGRRLWATHVTATELITWAYSISSRQIEHGPAWLGTERFDVSALPETEAEEPSREEYRSMLQAVLAERFGLKTHASQRLLPVYVMTVANTGLKVPAAATDGVKPTWGVHRGWFSVTNMSFAEVARILQRTVFERPVLDETGLKGMYSFTLKWRAEDSQFGQMQGLDVPQEADTQDAEDIYTASRRQLGINLTASKAMTPTMVVEAIAEPTPN